LPAFPAAGGKGAGDNVHELAKRDHAGVIMVACARLRWLQGNTLAGRLPAGKDGSMLAASACWSLPTSKLDDHAVMTPEQQRCVQWSFGRSVQIGRAGESGAAVAVKTGSRELGQVTLGTLAGRVWSMG